MPTFLLTYRAPKDYTAGGPDTMAAWGTYFTELGSRLVDPGNPVFARTTLGDCGTDLAPLGGYSIVTADDLEAAVDLARGCPILTVAGGVEVGVITELDPTSLGAN